MKNVKWYSIIFLLITGMLFSSCSPARKLAKTTVENSNQWGVLVLFPQQLFKINDRYDRDESGLAALDEATKQDSLLAQTLLLSKLEDSLLLNRFKSAYYEALKTYRVKVYSEADFDSFYSRDSLSWIANIAQIELQEFISDYEDEDNFFGMRYTHTVPLNGVNFAVWVELNALNENASENKVYFTDQNLFDYLQGQFSYDFFTGGVNYYYDVDSLKPADILDFAGFMGRLSAAYTFDQILNNQLAPAKDEQTEALYFRYDPYIKRLFQTENDRFIELE